VFAKRNLRYPLLEIFDLPDMHNSCPQRSVTTTAPQALALLNGEFALERARQWSERLLAEHGTDLDALVRAAYAEAFARAADDEQVRAAREFLDRQAEAIGGATSSPAALADFCHAILNSNEFLYVD
jgi:hypothetical protein